MDLPFDRLRTGADLDVAPNLYDETWAREYVSRYADRDPVERVADFLARRAAPGGPVVEWCVGTGRIAVPLAARGYRVTGVDSSSAMLDLLRGPGTRLGVEVVEGDCCTVTLDRRYPLAYSVFNSLFLLAGRPEQDAALRNAARHLTPGGRLVVETFVSPGERPARERPRVVRESADEVVMVARCWDAGERELWVQRVTADTAGRTRVRPYRFLYLDPAEIDALAAGAGLRKEAEFSDWNESPFGPESYNRIAVFRRAESEEPAGDMIVTMPG